MCSPIWPPQSLLAQWKSKVTFERSVSTLTKGGGWKFHSRIELTTIELVNRTCESSWLLSNRTCESSRWIKLVNRADYNRAGESSSSHSNLRIEIALQGHRNYVLFNPEVISWWSKRLTDVFKYTLYRPKTNKNRNSVDTCIGNLLQLLSVCCILCHNYFVLVEPLVLILRLFTTCTGLDASRGPGFIAHAQNSSEIKLCTSTINHLSQQN